MIRTLVIVVVVVLAGCASNGGTSGRSDASNSSDAPVSSCVTTIGFVQPVPPAGPMSVVYATASPTTPGLYSYQWSVTFQGVPTSLPSEGSDGSQTHFAIAEPGIYDVQLAVTGPAPCDAPDVDLNVPVAGAGSAAYRLRVTPPPTVAPPQESRINVVGGGDYSLGPYALYANGPVSGKVVDGAGQPVSAYLRFSAELGVATPIETFSGTDGTFAGVSLLAGVESDVTIVPLVPGDAPTTVIDWQGQPLVVDAGTAITGTVLGPSGAPVVGAKIQIELGQLPTTMATTDASGAFTVAGDLAAGLVVAGSVITVEVVAAPASGLPRLTASSASFDLTKPLQIHYAPGLVLRDVGGVAIRRGGAAVADGTAVSVVGTIGSAGTTTAGATAAPATGTTVVAVTTNGGALPAGPLLVPAVPLAVVIEAAGASVSMVDLTTTVPAVIDSAAPQVTTGTVRDATGAALGGVAITATGDGPLALAADQPVTTTAAADGSFALPLAAAGTYDVRVVDPKVRAAPGTLTSVVPSAAPLAFAMPATIHVLGTLSVQGAGVVGPGTSVQILCATCSGTASDLPLGEATTDGGGRFTVAIPDPSVDPLVRRPPVLDTVTRWIPSGWWSRLSRW